MIGQAKITAILSAAALFMTGCAVEASSYMISAQSGEAFISADMSGKRLNEIMENIGDSFRLELEKKLEYEKKPYLKTPPDESGRVMIVMFHSFVEEYEEGGDTKITTTLAEFRQLMERLYSEGYRTIPLKDFITGDIKLERGLKPVIFTFDDGRHSQFRLTEDENGNIVSDPKTAVGVMEEFYNEHPDFGLNGTFFLNLGFKGTFGTVGTLQERLSAIAAKGLELENHSLNHANLAKVKSADGIAMEVGGNSKRLSELLDGRTMSIFALPYGISNKALETHIISGEYEGLAYKNDGIMLVGSEPAVPMYLKGADTVFIRRILASGIVPVDLDFGWWLDYPQKHEYISDGDPKTISVPAEKAELVDTEKVKALGKELIIIE